MAECACGGGVKLVYSCSGAADVGEISDRAARQLRKEGFAQGSCVAALGADLSGFIQSAKGADLNITIDGCPVACSKKIMEKHGITPLSYVVTEMGFTKGSTHATAEVIEAVCANIREGKTDKPKEKTFVVEGGGCGCGGNC
jgi:uncharacterized metal-binding protein